MIAKRIQRSAGRDNFDKLACYIADLKNVNDPRSIERLADYIAGPKGAAANDVNAEYDPRGPAGTDRVVGMAFHNCDADTFHEAVLQIAATQAANRRSKTDKSYHLVISFQEGERPTLEQLRDIEARLVAAIGFEEHQRISTIHDDTDNLHIHVAINKVHPESYRNVEPFYDKDKLMAACVALELTHDLIQENHGKRAKLRMPKGAERMEAFGHEISFLRWTCEVAAPHLIEAAHTATSWADLHKVAADYGVEIRTRGAGLIIAASGERIQVKASEVSTSLAFKALTDRLGAYEKPDPSLKDVTPIERYEAGPRSASAALFEAYKKDRAAVTQGRDATREAYEKARELAKAARDEVLGEYNARVLAHAKQLKERHETAAFRIRTDTYLVGSYRKDAWKNLKKARQADWARHSQTVKAERARIRENYPIPTWADYLAAEERERGGPAMPAIPSWREYLEREAQAGSQAALAALRHQAKTGERLNDKILSAEDLATATHAVFADLKPIAKRNGDMLYKLRDGGEITDRASGVRIDHQTSAATFTALVLAMKRFDGQGLVINGSDEFKASIAMMAAARDLPVRFADPKVEALRVRNAQIIAEEAAKVREDDPLLGYCSERNATRARGINIMEHRPWTKADTGQLTYEGRRQFKDGTEALLFSDGEHMLVKPATKPQAAMASTWRVGWQIRVEESGRLYGGGKAPDRSKDAGPDIGR